MTKEEYNDWGSDPLSAEIDQQVAGMPDRPTFLLVVITFNKTPEEARFRAMGPYMKYYMRDFPYVIFGTVKACATIFGFEPENAAALGAAICSLSDMNLDEAVLFIDGKASLRLKKLTLKKPPGEVEG